MTCKGLFNHYQGHWSGLCLGRPLQSNVLASSSKGIVSRLAFKALGQGIGQSLGHGAVAGQACLLRPWLCPGCYKAKALAKALALPWLLWWPGLMIRQGHSPSLATTLSSGLNLATVLLTATSHQLSLLMATSQTMSLP